MSEKLVQTVHKLEDKIRQLRTEQKETAQRLELAALDKELAEEKARVVESELTALKSEHDASATEHTQKLAELKELTQINAELEEIWQQREKELERMVRVHETNYLAASREIATLKQQLALPVAQEAQQSEALRLEVENLKLRLKGAELELETQQRGLFTVLAELSTWAPLVRYAAAEDANVLLVVEQAWKEYRNGDIALKTLDSLLADAWKAFTVPEQPALAAVLQLIKDNGTVVPKHLQLQAQRGAVVSGATVRPFLIEGTAPPLDVVEQAVLQKDDQALESAQARIAVLESKVNRARDLASQLKVHEEREAAAHAERDVLARELAAAHNLAKAKDEEMGRLRHAQLPQSLDSADAQQRVRSMQSALTFLASRRRSSPLRVPVLDIDPPSPPTKLAGQARVTDIRRALAKFDVAATPREAGPLALRQNAELYKLFN